MLPPRTRRGPSEGMDILYGVAAYLKWEQLGKPQVTELQRSDIYAGAVNVINKRLDDGETIDALEREYGLPPGLVKKTAMEAAKKGASAPPPPPPVAPSPPPMPAAAAAKLPPAAANSIVSTPPAAAVPTAAELSPSDIARLCEQRAGGAPLYWRKELNMGDGAVKLMVMEARRAASGALQTIVMLRSDHDTVLHWATQSEPAGEWKQPPAGMGVRARQLVGHGRGVVGDGDGARPRRAGMVRVHHRGARGRGRRRLRHSHRG